MAARVISFFTVASVLLLVSVVPLGDTMLSMTHRLTKDMTLMCNLTSFLAAHRDDNAAVKNINIVQRTRRQGKPEKDNFLAALATLGNLSSLVSPVLLDSNRVFDISNFFFNKPLLEQTYFTLLYTDLDIYDYGKYLCNINYVVKDHYTVSTYNTTIMDFLPSTIQIQKQGSSLNVDTGLALTCTFTSSSDTDLNSNDYTIRIAHYGNAPNGSGDPLAAWHGGNLTNCTRNTAYCTRAVVRRAITMQNAQGATNTVILRVHLQKVSCKDQGTYMCHVDRPGTTTLNDSTEVERVSGCPLPGAAVGRKADRVVLTVVGLVIVVLQVFKIV
ncbi:uncharacterized protein [Littorina saxatilis]|uniref:uncharacterized protein isoform X2 n=1 Tax=Littorina saxatilis TaxID=31220 RepID=UPI0038B5C4C9